MASQAVSRPSNSSAEGFRDRPHDVLTDSIALLMEMRPEESNRILASLPADADPQEALTRIQSGSMNPEQVGSTAEWSSLSLELEACHPLVYPVTGRLDIRDDESPLRWLVEAKEENSYRLRDCPALDADASVEFYRAPRGLQHKGRGPCDPRLDGLNVSFWTIVPIENELAAQIISLYLADHHPCLGSFDPDLFIRDLMNEGDVYCSSLLVDAIMYLGLQLYRDFDDDVDEDIDYFIREFCREAERIWDLMSDEISLIDMLAAQVLSLASMVRGDDRDTRGYLGEAIRIGTSLGLFGVGEDDDYILRSPSLGDNVQVHQYAAWGVFNWATMMRAFYLQPGIKYPDQPPNYPIPEPGNLGAASEETQPESQSTIQYRANIAVLSKFWRIVSDVLSTYSKYSHGRIRDHVSVQFAEFKFRELMAWADALPSSLAGLDQHSPIVIAIQLWLHGAILGMFRPFLNGSGHQRVHLTTFSSRTRTPNEVYAASVHQMKRIVVSHRQSYGSSTYSTVWHVSLVHFADAMLQMKHTGDWLIYAIASLYGYDGVRQSKRVALVIACGMMSLELHCGDKSGGRGWQLLEMVDRNELTWHLREGIRSRFMEDVNQAVSQLGVLTEELIQERVGESPLMELYLRGWHVWS